MTTRPHNGISCPVCDSFFNVTDLSDKPIFDDTGPRLIVALSTICGECDTSYKLYCEATNVILFENSGVMIDPDKGCRFRSAESWTVTPASTAT